MTGFRMLAACVTVACGAFAGSYPAVANEWHGNAVTVGDAVYGCTTIEKHRQKTRDPGSMVEGCYLLFEEQLIRVIGTAGDYYRFDTPIAFGDLYTLYVPRNAVRFE